MPKPMTIKVEKRDSATVGNFTTDNDNSAIVGTIKAISLIKHKSYLREGALVVLKNVDKPDFLLMYRFKNDCIRLFRNGTKYWVSRNDFRKLMEDDNFAAGVVNAIMFYLTYSIATKTNGFISLLACTEMIHYLKVKSVATTKIPGALLDDLFMSLGYLAKNGI